MQSAKKAVQVSVKQVASSLHPVHLAPVHIALTSQWGMQYPRLSLTGHHAVFLHLVVQSNATNSELTRRLCPAETVFQ